jgi:hypothetical protein
LYARWVAEGSAGLGFQTNGGTQLRLLGTNGFVGLTLMPNEAQQVQVALKLHNQYPDPQGQVFYADLLQYGGVVPGATNPLVGGQRFTFNFNQLDIVPKGATWRYWAYGKYPGQGWNIVDFNDQTWASGEAKLGYGIGDESAVIGQGPASAPYITAWFRYDFTLNDPAFFANQPLWLQLETYDGAVVYLNGIEIARLRMPAGPVSPDTRANAAVRGVAAETFYPFDVSGLGSLLNAKNVLAVEVHLADTNAPHLGLDAELAGNVFAPRFPPKVAFLSLTNGGLSAQYLVGQKIRLAAEALGPVNPVKGVTFYNDGTVVGTIMNPPYVLDWQAPPGLHQLTAEAFDSAGQTGRAFATVRVLTNLPPVVYMTNPAPGAVFTANSVISLGATASELAGTVARVDFYYVRHGPAINNPYHLAGTALTPPYSAQITNLPPACYMLSAVATDTFGQRSYSVPVAIFVTPKPRISISVLRPYLIVNWTPTNAVLEQAVSPAGPWQPLPDATSPYGFLPAQNGPIMFYRAVLPPSAYEALCNALLLKP